MVKVTPTIERSFHKYITRFPILANNLQENLTSVEAYPFLMICWGLIPYISCHHAILFFLQAVLLQSVCMNLFYLFIFFTLLSSFYLFYVSYLLEASALLRVTWTALSICFSFFVVYSAVHCFFIGQYLFLTGYFQTTVKLILIWFVFE